MSKVYIIGAGASAEIDLPIGVELKKTIKNILKKNNYIIKKNGEPIAHTFLRDYDQYNSEINYLLANLDLAYSIDTLVENVNDENITFIAKRAIFASILQAESQSKIFTKNIYTSINFKKEEIQNSWYIRFFQIISKRKKINADLDSLKELFSNTTFIVFNYDRCLEFMLFNIFRSYFGLSDDDNKNLIDSLNIIHPYGSLGSIFDVGYGGHFCGNGYCHNLDDSSQRIKTYSETIKEEDFNLIQKAIWKTTHRIFLGFSYERQNMELLKAKSMYQPTHCYGTSYGMSEINTEHTKNLIQDIMPGTKHHDNNEVTIVTLKNITCSEFFTEFEKVIE